LIDRARSLKKVLPGGDGSLAGVSGSLWSWLTYALVIVLAYQLADLLWRGVETFHADVELTSTIERSPAPEAVERAPAASVVWKELMLFGPEPDPSRVVATEPAKPKPAPKRPKEPVRAKLYGTVSSSNPANSLAVIAAKSGPAEVYRVGDEIQDGVVITEVGPRSVLLAVGDAQQEIWMEDPPGGQARPMSLPDPARSQGGRAEASEKRIVEPEVVQKLEGYRKELEENPLALMDKLRVFVVQRDGQPYGVRVRPGTDRALLGQLGLRSGDILLSLNGVPLNDISRLADVIGQLRGTSELTAEVDRGGRRQSMRVVIGNTGAN